MEQKEEILLGKTEIDEKPPYPDEPIKGKAGSFTDRIPEESSKAEQKVTVDAHRLCRDLVRAAGQMAHIANKKIRIATEDEINNIGEPLANVIEKYNLTQYAKYLEYTQEVLLVYNIYGAVSIRVKEVKEDKHIDVDA